MGSGSATNNRYIMAGLSYTNPDHTIATQQYCWYTYLTGFTIMESGSLASGTTLGGFGALNTTAVLKIARENGMINYYKDDVLQRSVTDPQPETAMIVDFSLFENARSIYSLKIGSVSYDAVAVMKADYYPFGMTMPGRSSNANTYRYAYNGMEQDMEMKGQGNSYTTEFRQYDPRLGRWLSLDPLAAQFPWQSPYNGFDDNPVLLIDPSGLKTEGWIREKGSGDAYVYSDKYNDKASAAADGFDYVEDGSIIENARIRGGELGTVWAGYGAEDLEYLDMNNQANATPLDDTEGALDTPLDKMEEIPILNMDPITESEENNSYSWLSGVDFSEATAGFTLENPERRYFNESLRTSWQKTMYKFCDKAQEGVLTATFIVATAGVGAELYGAGYLLASTNLTLEMVSQTTTQVVQGDVSVMNYDLIALGTAPAVPKGLGWQMGHGASGSVLTFTLKDGFQSPVLQKNSSYVVGTTVINVILTPLMGKAPLAEGVGGEALNETVGGGMQGVVERLDQNE